MGVPVALHPCLCLVLSWWVWAVSHCDSISIFLMTTTLNTSCAPLPVTHLLLWNVFANLLSIQAILLSLYWVGILCTLRLSVLTWFYVSQIFSSVRSCLFLFLMVSFDEKFFNFNEVQSLNFFLSWLWLSVTYTEHDLNKWCSLKSIVASGNSKLHWFHCNNSICLKKYLLCTYWEQLQGNLVICQHSLKNIPENEAKSRTPFPWPL